MAKRSFQPSFYDLRGDIMMQNYGELELLRNTDLSPNIEKLCEWYESVDDWNIKDGIVFLIQDLLGNQRVKSIMTDALKSNHESTKVIALCHLKNDISLFKRIMTNSQIDPQKLQVEVDAYLKEVSK